MRIEILYFEDCPNYKQAIGLVQEVLREERVSAQVTGSNVADDAMAQRTRFLGSPTIRVDGLDVEPAARESHDFGLMCRTYLVDGSRQRLPSREAIRQAVRSAGRSGAMAHEGCAPVPASRGEHGTARSPSLLMIGSILAAIGASLCCTLPIVFAVTGFSILGASAFFESIRPHLLVATAGLLSLGFYYAYRPIQHQECAPGSVCAVPGKRRTTRVAMWVITVVAIAFAAFPYYSGPVAEFVLSGGL